MAKYNYEFVQKIESHYVGDDCIQIMTPCHLNECFTILNKDGIQYHYKPNSKLFINKYLSDERKNNFPYSDIPNHKKRIKFKKFEFINQLFDYNKIYIEMSEHCIKQNYVIKDGDEAFLAVKFLIPDKMDTLYMNHDEVSELLKSANLGIYSLDGGCYENYRIPDNIDETLLNEYKKRLYEYKNEKNGISIEDYDRSLEKSINKLTVEDLPENIRILDDVILISSDNNEINSMKGILVYFMGSNEYKVEIFNFPLTIYTLEHMKKLEQTNLLSTPEPKFNKFLNPTIDQNEIKKQKKLVLEKRLKKNTD